MAIKLPQKRTETSAKFTGKTPQVKIKLQEQVAATNA